MNILVINCGSSSLKFQLMNDETEEVIAKGLCERIGAEGSRMVYTPAGRDKIIYNYNLPSHDKAIQLVLQVLTSSGDGVIQDLSMIDAVGHRVVHGGEEFANPVIIDNDVMNAIEECCVLAPLHNPANLEGIRACMELMPEIPMTAVFDTSFHQTMPERAYLYGLPYSYYVNDKIRRYGFHGTSHSYVSKRASDLLGKPLKELKLIVCHLGNGASVTAVSNGVSADTSMGFTPLEGLVMGTRSGDMDPAIAEYLTKKEGINLSELMEILNHKSGVYGLSSGLSSDFRDLIEGAKAGDCNAERAIEVFCYHVIKYIGAYAAALNGVDGIAFTAGLGENSGYIRSRICKSLTYLGAVLDEQMNESCNGEKVISKEDSKVAIMAIPTNEELEIVKETKRLIASVQHN